MKQDQTTSWLYFCMLCCNDTQLTFIGWIWGTKPYSSVAMPVTKYEGGKFLGIWLCLAPAQNLKRNFNSKIEGTAVVFLTSSSCCSHHPIVLFWTRAQSNNINCKAAWLPSLKYFQACWLAVIGRTSGLSISDNHDNNSFVSCIFLNLMLLYFWVYLSIPKKNINQCIYKLFLY